ncbi:uncharacterized protein LOC128258880 [Drosophila gunungcola]|uniref:uncharacterized protein LOC128258880 n=1 Tax=Drosophila gunungcola TaxID=103775 RepID=UPI0022E32584|nr:uncharacterized protein LOC128258880 [Drosophila gunungcola]
MKDQILNLFLPILIIMYGTDGKVFRVSKMECRSLDPSFTYFETCKVTRMENGRSFLYINEVILYKDPINHITLNLGAFKTANNRRIQFLNETLDFCVLGQQLLANKFFKFLMTPLMRFSNVNGTCPIQQDIIVNGFSVDENTIKEIPIPNGDYMFQLRTSLLKKWRTVVRVYATRVDKYSE